MTTSKAQLTLITIIGLALMVFGVISVGQEAQEGGTLHLVASSEGPDLDPVTYEAIQSIRRMDLIYDSLYYNDPDGELIPLLAKDFPELPDDETMIIEIHEGVEFHDGTELTAEDVKYTFDSIMDPDEGSTHLERTDSAIKDIEVLDKHTVQFNMENPTPIDIITPFTRGIASKEHREEMGSDEYSRNPVGSGPFELIEWERDDYMLLERNEDYWMKKPNLEHVRFDIVPEESTQVMRLIRGELDVVGVPDELLSRVREAADVEVKMVAQYHYTAMIFNMKKPPFDDRKVRKAIHYLVDREDIMKASKGELANLNMSITPPVVNEAWDFPEEEWKQYLPEQDIERGKELLDEAGLTGDPRFEVTLIGLSISHFPEVTTVMQDQLAEANIKAEVRNLDLGTWLDELDTTGTIEEPGPLEDQYSMIIYGWGAGSDPDGWLHPQFSSVIGGEPNTAQFSDPEVDEWLQQARSTLDREKRRELYIKAQTKILQEYPHIPMFNQVGAVGIRNRVHDYQPVPGYGALTPVVTPFSNVWVEQ